MDTATQSKHFHIFGHGISFSMSPSIQTAAFRHFGLEHTYDIRETKEVDEVADLIEDASFGGASVTMPHKLAVHKFCHDQTEHARRIGAINTLVVRVNDDSVADGGRREILGDNTDWSGLHAIITKHTSSWTKKPQVGLVIGAGGASRAAVYALNEAGLKHIYIANRTIANAQKIARDLREFLHLQVAPTLEDLREPPDIIIGTIPADKTCEDDFINLFRASQGLCIDMSYKPRQTPLLAAAERQIGWATVPGVEVLLSQAFDQFHMWTGMQAPQAVMVQAIEAHDRQVEKAGRAGKL